jgi:hypothetical protein
MKATEARRLTCPIRGIEETTDATAAYPVITRAPRKCLADGCAWWEPFGRSDRSDGQCVILNLGIIVNILDDSVPTGGGHG